MATSKIQTMVWIYCPGQAGVSGNERVDSVSSISPICVIVRMGMAEFTQAITDSLAKGTASTRNSDSEGGMTSNKKQSN